MTEAGERALSQPAIDISIVVPCYDRLNLLTRTIQACLSQQVDAPISWEIVVADNHPDRLAAPVVSAFDSTIPLRHIAAGDRNIAEARNLGVKAARGAFIAFVDDDEAPEPGWLMAHYRCLARTGADASFGAISPIFEGGSPPGWDPQGRYYSTDFGLPDGTTIEPLKWFPPRPRGVSTANVMLKRSSCFSGDKPFDEDFGRTGGEDTLLLLRLAQAGRRFVWCVGAEVVEFNEAGRQSFRYMCRRVQRSSRHSAEVRMAISSHKLLTRMSVYFIALSQLSVFGTLWALRRKPAYVLQICKALGKLGFARFEFIPE
ncbi:glycosyltransferase family 2 protein [Gluconacetobacter sacchari]|uniref:glycosyltransferase family 2 protein n=1 Tax=Gluconacetobacter sacchari TaxID=92759 RepID=UPI0039B4EE0D